MDSIDCMASIDCYSFSEHILVYVFVSLIGVYMSRGGPTRTAYSIFCCDKILKLNCNVRNVAYFLICFVI